MEVAASFAAVFDPGFFSDQSETKAVNAAMEAHSAFPLIFDRGLATLDALIHCWNRRWQVWYEGYFSGNSRHCAPVPSTHNTPFRTARGSCHRRPRRNADDPGRSTGSTNFHCSSVNSQRPVIRVARRHQSNSSMTRTSTPGNYETGSRQLPGNLALDQAAGAAD